MAHIIRSIARPPAAIVEAIGRFSAATLHEAQGRKGALDSRIKPIYSGMQVCGPAVTARCHPGDNIMLQAAIHYARAGDVIVVDAGGWGEFGFFGDVLATACAAKGIAGLVISSGVRDGLELRRRGFPVFSLGLCMKGTVKETLGAVNRPIVVGGESIRPGDIVRGDDDGVVVVRREEAETVIQLAEARDAKEARMMEVLRAGDDIFEVLGTGKLLQARGLEVAD